MKYFLQVYFVFLSFFSLTLTSIQPTSSFSHIASITEPQSQIKSTLLKHHFKFSFSLQVQLDNSSNTYSMFSFGCSNFQQILGEVASKLETTVHLIKLICIQHTPIRRKLSTLCQDNDSACNKTKHLCHLDAVRESCPVTCEECSPQTDCITNTLNCTDYVPPSPSCIDVCYFPRQNPSFCTSSRFLSLCPKTCNHRSCTTTPTRTPTNTPSSTPTATAINTTNMPFEKQSTTADEFSFDSTPILYLLLLSATVAFANVLVAALLLYFCRKKIKLQQELNQRYGKESLMETPSRTHKSVEMLQQNESLNQQTSFFRSQINHQNHLPQ